MTQNERRPEAPPTPDEIAERIAELVALEASDPTSFAEWLADNVMDPVAVDTHAFRSDELAFKSFTAARYLIDRANQDERRFRANSEKQRRVIAYRQRVAREARILDNIVNGIKARNGILPAAPNPRRRAKERLWSEAMKGDALPAGRWREILDEELEKDRERKKQAKKARRDARRTT